MKQASEPHTHIKTEAWAQLNSRKHEALGSGMSWKPERDKEGMRT